MSANRERTSTNPVEGARATERASLWECVPGTNNKPLSTHVWPQGARWIRSVTSNG